MHSLCKAVTIEGFCASAIHKGKSDVSTLHEQMFHKFSSSSVCSAAANPSCELCTSLSMEKTHTCLPLGYFSTETPFQSAIKSLFQTQEYSHTELSSNYLYRLMRGFMLC